MFRRAEDHDNIALSLRNAHIHMYMLLTYIVMDNYSVDIQWMHISV